MKKTYVTREQRVLINEKRRGSSLNNKLSTWTKSRIPGRSTFGSDQDEDQNDERCMYSKISEISLIKDKKQELNLDRHALEKVLCDCDMCKKHAKIIINDANFGDSFEFFRGCNFDNVLLDQDKDFVFVLRRLIPSKLINRSLRIFIPDTVAIMGGELKFIVITSKVNQDRSLKFIKQREKLMFGEVRKFFQERRRKTEDFYTINDSEENKIENEDLTGNEKPIVDKNKSSIGPPNLMTKPNSINEVAIIKHFSDAVQILTEQEFNNLFQKRKIDPVWKESLFIQSYVRLKKEINSKRRVYFIYEDVVKIPLFKRALNEILYLAGDIPQASEDFIPLKDEEKFEDNLKAESEEKYCLYILIKIFHFLHVISGTKILKMAGEFVKDEQGYIWLCDLIRVESIQVKPVVKEETAIKLDEPPKLNLRLSHKTIEYPLAEFTGSDNSKQINNVMHGHYENIKKSVGIEIEEPENEEDISDKIFKKIHPEANFKLSEVLQTKVSAKEVRKFYYSTISPSHSPSKRSTTEIAQQPPLRLISSNLVKPQISLRPSTKDFSIRSSTLVPHTAGGRTRTSLRSASVSAATETRPATRALSITSNNYFPRVSSLKTETIFPSTNLITQPSNYAQTIEDRVQTENSMIKSRLQTLPEKRRSVPATPIIGNRSTRYSDWGRTLNPEIKIKIEKTLNTFQKIERSKDPKPNSLAFLLQYDL